MNYIFNIKKKYFDLIKNKEKMIELRLFDEKRKLIKINDIITFIGSETKEELKAKVINLYKAKNFEKLSQIIDIEKTGFKSLEELIINISEFYTVEKINSFGVLGIEIELL